MSATIWRLLTLACGTGSALLSYTLWTKATDAKTSAIIWGCFALYAIIGAAVWDFRGKP